MLKKLAAAGALTAAIGGVVLGAGPAYAGQDPSVGNNNGAGNFQILPVQTCRGIDVVGIGAAIKNILGMSNESGACVNGPATAQGN